MVVNLWIKPYKTLSLAVEKKRFSNVLIEFLNQTENHKKEKKNALQVAHKLIVDVETITSVSIIYSSLLYDFFWVLAGGQVPKFCIGLAIPHG